MSSQPESWPPPSSPQPAAIRLAWGGAGLLALVLGIIGVVVPLLPTTPFVILAAFAFGKGSPRLRHWLVHHALFGQMIRDWESSGAIAPRHKAIACCAMGLVFAISLALGLRPWILGIQAVFLGASALFVLSRPNGK